MNRKEHRAKAEKLLTETETFINILNENKDVMLDVHTVEAIRHTVMQGLAQAQVHATLSLGVWSDG